MELNCKFFSELLNYIPLLFRHKTLRLVSDIYLEKFRIAVKFWSAECSLCLGITQIQTTFLVFHTGNENNPTVLSGLPHDRK